MNINEIQQIITMLKQSDVTEFELDHDGTKIRLARGTPAIAVQSGAVQTVAMRQVELEPAIVTSANGQAVVRTEVAAPLPSNLTKVESPIVGTFYRRPSPDAEPFVKEGDRVKKGDTMCIIEAMKVMNEIDAPCSGKIEKVFLSDGNVVEFGEVLFLINPEA
jgi:acetyl-CoA carboxylase biotin carboxyl carrier protein